MIVQITDDSKAIYENGQWLLAVDRTPITFPYGVYEDGAWILEEDKKLLVGYVASFDANGTIDMIGDENMTVSSSINGHKLIVENNQWVYADDKTPFDNKNPRGCIKCGCNCDEKPKTLDISDVKGATANISDLKVVGDGDTWKLLCKASSEQEGWMKSTKVLNLHDACLVQVTTQQRNPDGSYAVAEAVTYVPSMNIDVNASPRKIVPLSYGIKNSKYLKELLDLIEQTNNE